MYHWKNGILLNLGLTEAALVSLRAADDVLDEMCRDLEDLANAIDDSATTQTGLITQQPDQHLIKLISELEIEIRLRLRTRNYLEPKSQSDTGKD